MKFCANISFLFTEVPFWERYRLAREAGLRAVESGYPYGVDVEKVVAAKEQSQLDHVLLNVYTGDVSKGELGCAAICGAEQEFQQNFATSLMLAKRLQVKKLHIMAGCLFAPCTGENDRIYEENLKSLVGPLKSNNIIGLIEPLNSYTVPNYYLNSFHKALDIVKRINSPHIRLMLDIFHLQQIHGALKYNLTDLMPYVGHIQVAQVPDRNEPTCPGEINYNYIFDLIKRLGYSDWIGLEYKPAEGTKEGLTWITDMGFSL